MFKRLGHLFAAAGGKKRGTGPARKRGGRRTAGLRLEELEGRLVPALTFNTLPTSPVGADRPQLIAVGSFHTGPVKPPDLVVTTSAGFTALFGDGQGHFGNPIKTTLPNTANPEGIVTGDFENNGTTDVAVAAYGGGVPGAVITYRYSLGTFTAIQGLPLLPGAGPTYLATADLNHDGKLDLLVADFNNNAVISYLGQGDGKFGGQQIVTGNGIVNPNQIVVADFDGDGIPDFAVANKGNGSVSVFKGNGDGTFTAAGNFSLQTVDGRTGGDVGSVGLAAGDLDGDGKPDLAVANYGTDAKGAATLSLLRNTSANGTISFAAPVNIGLGDHLINVAIADFNGDGKMDLAVSSAGNTDDPNAPADHRVLVLVNQQPGAGQLGFDAPGTLTAGANPVGLVAADINGDGRPDLLAANQNSGDVSVFVNQTPFPGPPGNGPSPLHVEGTQLKDANGNAVVLRGVNVPSLEYYAPGVNVLQSVDVAINDWHANLIRLPLNEDFWFGYDNSPNADPAAAAAYQTLVDQVVQKASDAGVYVMLDLHWSDMGARGSYNDQHDLPDDLSTTFWQQVAAKYANNPAILFDPYNEPHDQDWATWRNGGPVTETWTDPNNPQNTVKRSYTSPGLQGLLDTIRGTGAKNVVAPEGLDWGDDLSGITADPSYALVDSTHNLMYQIHLYPGAAGDDAARDARVDAVAAKSPICVGEWGADPHSSLFHGTADQAGQFNQTMLAWLKQHQYSWTAWSLNTQTYPALIADFDTYTPTDYFGKYVKEDLIAENNGGQKPPAPPTGLQATAGNGQVTLTWQASAGASSYTVYRGTAAGAEDAAPYASGITTLSFIDTAAANGTTYYYVVSAVNAAGTSAKSAEASATPQAPDNGGPAANRRYVAAAYRAVLGRDADPAALATWGALLDAGAPPSLVSGALTHSAEYYQDFVTAAYGRYLGRKPDDPGLAGWVAAMQHGLTDERVEAFFIGSDEYIQDHGGTGRAWVEGMYRDLLGRTPAGVEVDAWVAALANGVSALDVAYGFAASREREGQRVTADYQTYLGRAPSPAEVDAWVGGFLAGLTNEDVVAGFVGSAEYFKEHSH